MQSQTETRTPLTLPEALRTEQALSLSLVEGLLSAACFRADCPSPIQLLELAVHLLPASERPGVEHHLRACQDCQEDLILLTTLETPQPSPLLTRVLDAGRRLIRAVLEPLEPGPALALRGESSTTRLRYQAGERELLISIRPSQTPGAGYELEGQLEPCTLEPLNPKSHAQVGTPDANTGTVLLHTESGACLEETIDGLGFFVLEHVPSGNIRLELLLPEASVVVEALKVP